MVQGEGGEVSDWQWTHEQAVALCREIEAVCPAHGCHVALTGGTLYKDGLRKDLDILFYRIRQIEKIDEAGLFAALEKVGIKRKSGFGWCIKAFYGEKKIDCFFPEEDGEYPVEDAVLVPGPVGDGL